MPLQIMLKPQIHPNIRLEVIPETVQLRR